MAEQNKEVFRRFVEVGLNKKDVLSISNDICQPDLTLEAPGVPTAAGHAQGHQIFNDSVVGFTTAFPDVDCTLEYLVADGDTLAADISYHGTHEAEFAGVPATHRHIKGGELWYVNFENGKMKHIRICEYGVPLVPQLLAK
jgi:predicted ester cyclase